MTRLYTDPEVDARVANLMGKLPKGAAVTSRVENGRKSVHLTVSLPDHRTETFEHGIVMHGRWKTKPRPGPEFDDAAIAAIVEWSGKK